MRPSSELPQGAFKPEIKKSPCLVTPQLGNHSKILTARTPIMSKLTDGKQKVDFCITVRNGSMTHTGINDGDIVFIRQQPEVENVQVSFFEIDGKRGCLKRFYKTTDGVILVSETPKYALIVFTADNCDDVKFFGLAVIKQSKI